MHNTLRALLLLLVLAAMWLAMARVATLGRDSLQYDEIRMLRVASQPTDAAFEAAIPADAAPLGYHILRAWGVEGRGDAALRVPAFLFGLLSLLPLIGIIYYATPARLIKWTPIFTLIGALSLFMLPSYNHFLHRLTPESAAMFFILFSVLFSLLWVKSYHWGWAVALAISSGLALLSHFAAVIPIMGMLIGCLITPFLHAPIQDRKARLGQLTPALACFVFIMFWMVQKSGANNLSSLYLLIIGSENQLVDISYSFMGLRFSFGEIAFALFAAVGVYQNQKSLFPLFCCMLIASMLSLAAAYGSHRLNVSFQFICQTPLIALQPLGLFLIFRNDAALELKDSKVQPASSPVIKVNIALLILFIFLFLVLGRLDQYNKLRFVNKPYSGQVWALATAPHSSLAIVPTNVTKYCYEFYKDKRFPGAPEARVFDPGSQYQAELMLALDRVYVVDVGMPSAMQASSGEEQQSGVTEQEALNVFRELVQLRGGSVEAWLPPLTVLWAYKVSPDIGPLPGDGVIPLGSGDGGGPFYIVRGLYKPEMWGDTQVRWAHPHARVAAVLSPEQAERFTKIRMKGYAWAAEKDATRTFELAVNGAPLGPQTMPALNIHTVEWPATALQPGLALLTLTTPDDVPQSPGDPRTLSLAIYEISFLTD